MRNAPSANDYNQLMPDLYTALHEALQRIESLESQVAELNDGSTT